ncbi:MAG: PAS domain S-box protein, partial [Bdellovibrionales bacterium]|nr:PAS domain S-box protein [Bdellovibrionales bacterium]
MMCSKNVETRSLPDIDYRLLVESTQEGIWTIDAQGLTTYVNPAMARLLQTTPEEMIGRHLFDFTDQEGRQIATRNLKRRENGVVEQHDFPLLRKDGSRMITTMETAPLFDPEGRYLGAIAGVIDVTDRRQAEAHLEKLTRRLELQLAEQSRELDRSQRQFEAIFNGAGDLIFFCDVTGNVMVANSAVETILGYSPSEFAQLHVLDIVVGLTEEEMAKILEDLRVIGVVTREDLHRHRDGSLIPVEVKLTQIHLDGKLGVVVLVRDLREKKKMEHSLFVSQKREAIGRLAGGIAHEYNNRLATILLAGRMALHHLGAEHPAREYLDRIMNSAQNSAILTKQLLAFGCQQVLHPRILNINSVIQNTERLLSPLLREDIELRLDLQASLAAVSFDPALFEQIIINLVINSRDALPDGGNIKIRTGHADLPSNGLGDFPAKAGNFVWIDVEDNGVGMDKVTLERAFEPFFTTKEVGQGTGLGLSMV